MIVKYVEALGGRAAVEALQSRVMSGTLVTRAEAQLAWFADAAPEASPYDLVQAEPASALDDDDDGPTAVWHDDRST